MSRKSNKSSKMKKKHRKTSDNKYEKINVRLTIISIFIAIFIAFLQSDRIKDFCVERNRVHYINALNNAFADVVNVDANTKFQNLLYKTNKEEYQDIHDYWQAMAMTKKQDMDSAKNYFSKISSDSPLFPAAIYSRMQCELYSAENSKEIIDRLGYLIECCNENNRSLSIENFMIKAIYYGFDLDYNGIKQTVNDFIESPYYTEEVIEFGVGENFFVDDLLVYRSIYTTLLLTMRYSAEKNEIYDDIEWIEQQLENSELRLRKIETSTYFNCGCNMIEDMYFARYTKALGNDFYKMNLKESDSEIEVEISNSDKNYIDIKKNKYKFK